MNYNIDTLIDRLNYQSKNNHIPKSISDNMNIDKDKEK